MRNFLIGPLVMMTSVMAMAGFNDTKYTISIMNHEGSLHATVPTGKVTTGVLAFVYDAGTKDLATLYSDAKRTSLANPITRANFATNAGIKFWTTATTVDIVLAHSDGSIGKYASVTPSMHSLVLNQDGVDKCLIVPFSASDESETDTGIDLPYNVQIKDVVVEVVTVDDTETLHVGLHSSETSGDLDGLLASIPMSPAGFYKGWATTSGSNEKYISSYYYGALMGVGVVGTDDSADFGLNGNQGHIVKGSDAVSLTYTGSNGSDTAAGYVYVYFRHLR